MLYYYELMYQLWCYINLVVNQHYLAVSMNESAFPKSSFFESLTAKSFEELNLTKSWFCLFLLLLDFDKELLLDDGGCGMCLIICCVTFPPTCKLGNVVTDIFGLLILHSPFTLVYYCTYFVHFHPTSCCASCVSIFDISKCLVAKGLASFRGLLHFFLFSDWDWKAGWRT